MNDGEAPEAVEGLTQPAGVTSGGRGSRQQPGETTSRQRCPSDPGAQRCLPEPEPLGFGFGLGQMERRPIPRLCNPRKTSCRGCPRIGVPRIAEERVQPGYAFPPRQNVRVNPRGFADAAPRGTTSGESKTQAPQAVLGFRSLSRVPLGFGTPQDTRSPLIGAWEEARNGQSLVKPKALIYYLICLPRRLRSRWKHLVLIAAQLLPNCTAGEIKP